MGSPPEANAGAAADNALRGRVLIVDDNEPLRRVLTRMLEREGHLVTTADSGREAIRILETGRCDVVLSDVRMPDVSGVELLEAVHERDADLPVVLMSGEPDLETAMKAVRFGALEYLTKPIPFDALEACIRRALALRRSRLQARQGRSGERARISGAPSAADESYTGALLGGRYRVGELIGKGGMGAVYEADREDLGRMRVAIKLMLGVSGERTDLLERFRREAELIAAIDHPNIVRVLDFHAAAGEPPFLVMERLHGMSLADAITADGRFSAERTAFIAYQVLDALGAAHRAGVVHRDLKPDNVFLTSMSGLSDIVKLLDFGVAKVLGSMADQKLTQTGAVIGTPAYMSPEQARGAGADPRSDLYAVGCMMYEALTGNPPFVADNYNALVYAVQRGSVAPLLTRRPDLDPNFAAVVAKAMSRDVNRRYQTAAEMECALSAWLVSTPAPSSGVPDSSPAAFAPTVLSRAGRKRKRPPKL